MSNMTSQFVNITTREVANLARVEPSTVRRWVESGVLVPTITTPGGHYRFSQIDVDALLTNKTTSSTSAATEAA